MTEDMNDDRWNEIVNVTKLWFDNHKGWEKEFPELKSIVTLVKAGASKPSKRVAYYQAMRLCFTDVSDKPYGTGKKSNMPSEQQAIRDGKLARIKASYLLFVEECPEILHFAVKNKRTVNPTTGAKGGLFVDAEDFAQYQIDAMRLRVNKAFNAHDSADVKADYTWNGLIESPLISQIPAKVIVEQEE